MKRPKIVITGGLGFIFSYVTEYFVQKGWDVVVIDNFSAGAHPEIIDGSFVHHNMHMANPVVVDLIVQENPDYLIHAAAITDVDYSVLEPHRTMTKNMYGTLHCFEAARRLPHLRKFMYTATDEIYGECDRPMREDDIILPKNPYSCSKALGSLVRVAYDNTFPELRGKTVETRMCNVFGARQDTRKIMPQIKKSLKEGYSIPLHQQGSGYREYIYVKNIPPVMDLILREGTGVYNISLNEGLTVKELIQKAEHITGLTVTTHAAHRPGMDRKYQVDASRLRGLGWKPLYTFEQGFREYFTQHSDDQKKKTIVVATNDLLMGGVQRLVIDQLKMIDRAIFDVHLVILMEFSGRETFINLVPSDVTVHHLRFSGFKDVKKWLRLVRLMRRLRPDIVKTATFFSNTIFLMLRPFFGYRVISAEHNTLRVKPLWQRFVDRFLLPQSHTIIADSPAVADFVSGSEGIEREKFTVIYNGVDLDAVALAERTYRPQRAAIRAEYDIPADAHVVLSVGRLVHQKNPQLMVEGFAELCTRRDTVYLMVVGAGKHEKEIARLVEERGLAGRVRLVGEQHNVHRFYAIADSFLLTSRHEGFCIAAMEALAFGLPVISTKVAGVVEYLVDGKNGFFVEPDAKDIAEKIEKIVSLAEERKKFSDAARTTAQEYSLQRYEEEFTGLLKQIVGGMNYANE